MNELMNLNMRFAYLQMIALPFYACACLIITAFICCFMTGIDAGAWRSVHHTALLVVQFT